MHELYEIPLQLIRRGHGMNNLKIGTINGVMAALVAIIPTWIISSSFNGSILGVGSTFICGAVFGICTLIFLKGDH